MKKHVILIVLVCLFVVKIGVSGQDIDPRLNPLEPLLNKTWAGFLKAPDGSAEFRVVRTFEVLNGGKVIRFTKINKDLNGYGEGFIHWNDIEQKAAFFFIEKGGVFQTGYVSVENDVITFEGQMTWPKAMPQGKQSYDFKNTFELKSKTEMVDSWFHNAFGPWRPGHVIAYKTAVESDMDRQKTAEIEDITKTIDSCIGWFKDKDFDRLFNTIVNDPGYISVHPGDRVVRGFDQFIKNSEIYKNPEFKYVRHDIRDLTIRLSKSGDVAWFYCRLDDINTWKGEPANWENARWTGVLEKMDGKWVIVQQHFSFPKIDE
ncbi:MAG: nuclear transport factor 2 family protein [Candidatus Aminicenantes bacterium]|nr:nuclear transport factor 2 family protein [Candidatus Aminicenantes bacterium]